MKRSALLCKQIFKPKTKSKMNKFLMILTVLGVVTMSSCKKEDTAVKTTVEIVVKDALSNKANWTVYQINDTKFNLYGADPFFKDQQSVTDNNGLATFVLEDLDFTSGGQRTYYFFATYSIGGVNKSKNIGVTLSKGDKKSGTLLLN
jgi:hypothetical protein